MKPRAVALLPTYNRSEMAHRAAHLFLAQVYDGPKTLLVFDDGEQPAEFCSECEPKIAIVHHARLKLPTKRNAMMEHVGDEEAIYFLWDDDDYHGPHRVARQVAVLEGRPESACILRPTLYYNSITKDLRVSTWVSDATVAYTWDFWISRRFNDYIDPGSGYQFVHFRTVKEIPGELDYITVVHNGQRHTPPAFGPPEFTETVLPASFAEECLKFINRHPQDPASTMVPFPNHRSS